MGQRRLRSRHVGICRGNDSALVEDDGSASVPASAPIAHHSRWGREQQFALPPLEMEPRAEALKWIIFTGFGMSGGSCTIILSVRLRRGFLSLGKNWSSRNGATPRVAGN